MRSVGWIVAFSLSASAAMAQWGNPICGIGQNLHSCAFEFARKPFSEKGLAYAINEADAFATKMDAEGLSAFQRYIEVYELAVTPFARGGMSYQRDAAAEIANTLHLESNMSVEIFIEGFQWATSPFDTQGTGMGLPRTDALDLAKSWMSYSREEFEALKSVYALAIHPFDAALGVGIGLPSRADALALAHEILEMGGPAALTFEDAFRFAATRYGRDGRGLGWPRDKALSFAKDMAPRGLEYLQRFRDSFAEATVSLHMGLNDALAYASQRNLK